MIWSAIVWLVTGAVILAMLLAITSPIWLGIGALLF